MGSLPGNIAARLSPTVEDLSFTHRETTTLPAKSCMNAINGLGLSEAIVLNRNIVVNKNYQF